MAFYKWADAKSFYQCHSEQQPEDLKEPTALAQKYDIMLNLDNIPRYLRIRYIRWFIRVEWGILLCIFISLWVLHETALGSVLDTEWFYPGVSRYSTLQTAYNYKMRRLMFLGSDKFWIVKVSFQLSNYRAQTV
jgi:hypothetical protein